MFFVRQGRNARGGAHIRGMNYPVSDHSDGEKFFNPEPILHGGPRRRKGFLALLRARLRRDPQTWARWPQWVEDPAPEAAPEDGPSVTWVGHSTFLLRLPELNVLTDPVFSARCSPSQMAGPKRVRAPGLALEALPRIDLILLSHNHYDHLDLPSLRRLRAAFPAARIVTLLGNGRYLDRRRVHEAHELDWWETLSLHGAHITATPARHFSARTPWDGNRALWGGFYVQHKAHRIFFAGDTGYTKFFSEIRHRLGPPDLALLPIGAYAPRWFMAPVHMDPEDAVRAFADLGAARAIGMHFGTFQLTAEGIDDPPQALAAARARAGVAPEVFFTLGIGQSARL